jgi:uncharacterized protein with PIN domain
MARFFSDENFPMPAVLLLRQLGHDVVTIQELGQANEATADELVLQLSTSDHRILLTLNRKDFYRLHERSPVHAGILVCVKDDDFARMADRIHQVANTVNDLTSKLIRIPPRDSGSISPPP